MRIYSLKECFDGWRDVEERGVSVRIEDNSWLMNKATGLKPLNLGGDPKISSIYNILEGGKRVGVLRGNWEIDGRGELVIIYKSENVYNV